MSTILAKALCEQGLVTGFAEVRRLIDGNAITINGYLATSYDEQVEHGDVIIVGKHKKMTVEEPERSR